MLFRDVGFLNVPVSCAFRLWDASVVQLTEVRSVILFMTDKCLCCYRY